MVSAVIEGPSFNQSEFGNQTVLLETVKQDSRAGEEFGGEQLGHGFLEDAPDDRGQGRDRRIAGAEDVALKDERGFHAPGLLPELGDLLEVERRCRLIRCAHGSDSMLGVTWLGPPG
jgi:hypothetical protein